MKTGKHGFTLIEALAASALTALLLLAMMSVIAGIGRERRAAADRALAWTPPDLAGLVQWDLVNARDIQTTPDGVKLMGFGSLDPRTLAPASHRPAEVTYEIGNAAGRSWLIRRQVEVDSQESSAELVCSGVAKIVMAPVRRPLATTRSATTEPSASHSLPDCVRLQVKWDDPVRPAIDRILVLR